MWAQFKTVSVGYQAQARKKLSKKVMNKQFHKNWAQAYNNKFLNSAGSIR